MSACGHVGMLPFIAAYACLPEQWLASCEHVPGQVLGSVAVQPAVLAQVRKNAAHSGQHFGQDATPDRTVLKRKAWATASEKRPLVKAGADL